ncbi:MULTISPECIES: histidine kinase N-terminal 7TM domain-containing diguanylate cyclase [Paenibacillus]|uniref:histidine kinase N-terminal 7TM domain-containing diguanylate cyclase n=1 Tax=Paenibacillus TaxID=44249 RepID=UPI0020BFA731|nr:diguanylate cyclase [Paenibacillus odorifer]
MPWIQGYPYYLLMGSVLSLYMGVSSYRHRKLAGRRYLWILMLLVSLIFVATAGEIMSPSFQSKLWWKNVQQAPLFFSALFTYAVVKEYVSPSTGRLPVKLAIFSIPIVMDVLLIFTDSYHHLMRSEVSVLTVAGVSGIAVKPTLLSMAFIAYDQLFGLYAVCLLAVSLLNTPRVYLRTNILLLAGLLVPVISVFLLPLLKITITGFTAFTYLPAIIAAYFALFVSSKLTIFPLTKNKILEHMKDGVVLTDRYDNIIGINDAATAILYDITGIANDNWMGKNIDLFTKSHKDIAAHYSQRTEGQFEVVCSGAGELCYGVSLIATEHAATENKGMLIVFSDHSEKKRYERELVYQATVDDLTGLYNRRHFMQRVQNQTIPDGLGLALLLFDIDDFKLINDTYGHLAGDQALVDFSNKILQVYQNKGIAGRVGGEEFAVCFFAEDKRAALKEAEDFRTMMSDYTIILNEQDSIHLTASIGISFTERREVTFEDLYREADEALYHSKNTGKNRVTLGREPIIREAVKG